MNVVITKQMHYTETELLHVRRIYSFWRISQLELKKEHRFSELMQNGQ